MPIKIRCQKCKHVFAVPDQALGRMVRCPKCKAKFRIPAQKPSSKPVKKQTSVIDDDPLAALDLSQLEDRSVRVCPKCGTEVSEDAIECPNCFVDLTTGTLSKAARRRLARRGYDPAVYYKKAWKDAWRFTLENKKIVLRTIMYLVFWTLVSLFCVFMVTWCRNVPPRVFWGFVATITGLAPIGWLWFLDVEIVRSTVNKDERLPKINFDFFACVATGIKFFVWTAAVFVQSIIGPIGVALMVFGMTLPGAILTAIGLLVPMILFPIATVHMAMPVSWPGWLINRLGTGFIRSAGAVLYCILIFWVTCLPVAAVAGGIGAWKGRDIARVAGTMVYNFKLPPPPSEDISKKKQTETRTTEQKPAERKPIEWKALIIPGIGLVVCLVMSSFVAVYNMRSNGMMALICKPRLGLITIQKETTYVPKTQRPDDKILDLETLQNIKQERLALGGWLYFGSLLLSVVLVVTVFTGDAFPKLANMLFGLASGAAVLILLTRAVGVFCFLTLPKDSNVNTFVVSVAVVELLAAAAQGAAFGVKDLWLIRAARYGGVLLDAVAIITFAVFLQQLGRMLRRMKLSKLATQTRNVTIPIAVLAIATPATLYFLPKDTSEKVVLGIVLGAGGLATLCAIASIALNFATLGRLGMILEDMLMKARRQRRRRSQVVEEE